MKSKSAPGASNTTKGEVKPHNIENEKVVLGALIINADFRSMMINILKEETFYFEGHQEIYKAILELYNTQQPVDLLTVLAQLRKNGKLESIGGIDYIEKLMSISSSPEEIVSNYYAILGFDMQNLDQAVLNKRATAAEDLLLKDKKS